MWSIIVPVAIGALLGAGLGYFGQCTSGTCPLTATWWRGALYGAAIGGVFAFTSVGRDSRPATGARSDSTNVVELAAADFDAAVIRSEQPVMVDFYAPWCGPCKKLAPTVAQLADEFAGKVKVVKINVDKAPAVAQRYQVHGVPTLMFFKGGKPVDAVVGLVSATELRGRLQGLAGS